MKQSPLTSSIPTSIGPHYSRSSVICCGKDYDWSKEVAAIKASTMIVFADADAVRPAHVISSSGLLGGGQKDAGLDGSEACKPASYSARPHSLHLSSNLRSARCNPVPRRARAGIPSEAGMQV